MQDMPMPSPLCGQWIWKKSLIGKSDTFVMFRREFNVSAAPRNADLWISANSAYSLFVNSQLVGFGPRARHNPASSYVDHYDLGYYLQTGNNVVGVIVYHNIDRTGAVYPYRVPGLWCQIEVDHRIRIGSDALWQMKEGTCFTAPRPRSRAGQVLTEYFDATLFDRQWADACFSNMPPWEKPDSIVEVGEYGTLLEPQPFSPPVIEAALPFSLQECGQLEKIPNHTLAVFSKVYRHGEWSYAVEAFVESPKARRVRTRFFSDDAVKVFCGNRLVLDSPAGDGINEGALPLEQGWNRILIVMEPSRFSMGLLMVFPDGDLQNADFKLVPEKKSRAAWHISGALKLPLAEATGSLHLGKLEDDETFELTERTETDEADLLRHAECTANEEITSSALDAGEYALYKLDGQRYGFPVVEFAASEGDLVDITVGLRRGEHGCPVRGNHFRGTHTIRCRKGVNRFLFFSPRECFYLMISPRRAMQPICVTQVEFLELHRPMHHETLFRCSDSRINAMWQAGRNMAGRAASVVPLAEPMARQDIFLFDSFMQSMNMAAVYGDSTFSERLLNELLAEQFENGNIPVLTCSRRHVSQLEHLFILPVWIAYHFQLTGDEGAVQELLPKLDLACEFFDSAVDGKSGLLTESDGSVGSRANALYCRFLLSAAELYHVAGREEDCKKCMAEANRLAVALKKANLDRETGLLAARSRDGKQFGGIDFKGNFAGFYGGVLPARAFDKFFERFFTQESPFLREETKLDAYDNFLFCEMLFAMRKHDWALEYLIDYWTRRFYPEAAAWKREVDSEDPAMVRFHDGIVVTPNVFFVREIAGIRMAGNAHSKIYFAPALNLVDFAEITLPVAYGRIKLRWEKLPDGLIDVIIDANYPLQVIPEMTAEELKKTQFALSDNVTLMTAAE